MFLLNIRVPKQIRIHEWIHFLGCQRRNIDCNKIQDITYNLCKACVNNKPISVSAYFLSTALLTM